MEKSRAKILAQTVGENLARIRREKGYSRKDLAALLNVTVQSLSLFERGLKFPAVKTLMQLAEIFNVTTAELTGEKSKEIEDKIFEYRLKRAMELTSPDFMFPAQKLPDGKISIYIPAKVTRDKDGTLTFFKADDNDFIGNTVTFKDDTTFVDVVERAENFAIINYIPFYQALRAVLQNIST